MRHFNASRKERGGDEEKVGELEAQLLSFVPFNLLGGTAHGDSFQHSWPRGREPRFKRRGKMQLQSLSFACTANQRKLLRWWPKKLGHHGTGILEATIN